MEVKVCPRCKSQDISPNYDFKFEQRAGLFREMCNNRGYLGTMIIMEKKDADKLEVKNE